MTEEERRKKLKDNLDRMLTRLQIKVARQLLSQVAEGDSLRAAIDFLRLNRRSVTEADAIRATRDPSAMFDDLLKDLKPGSKRERT